MSGGGDEGRLDVSRSAVSARLAAFVAEHKAALTQGDPRAFRESDRLLAAWASEALACFAEADRLKAEAEIEEAELERLMLARRGGRVQ